MSGSAGSLGWLYVRGCRQHGQRAGRAADRESGPNRHQNARGAPWRVALPWEGQCESSDRGHSVL